MIDTRNVSLNCVVGFWFMLHAGLVGALENNLIPCWMLHLSFKFAKYKMMFCFVN